MRHSPTIFWPNLKAMQILLDTQIFLWYISGDTRLPSAVLPHIQNMEHRIILSVVSLWEIAVKYHLGKLPLPQPPELYLPIQRRRHRIDALDLDEASVLQLHKLPNVHRAPFDRMLICQTIQHGLVLATVDANMFKYPVSTLPLTDAA